MDADTIVKNARERIGTHPKIINGNDLDNEKELVWVKDINKYDYVRSRFTNNQGTENTGRPSKIGKSHTLVGYVNLIEESGKRSQRRIFTVKSSDRIDATTCERNHPYRFNAPGEAVDPRTVSLGNPGVVTTRVMGFHTIDNIQYAPEEYQ